MTEEQAVKEYGDVLLVFSEYYKYSFSFNGVASDGAEIYVSIGGDSDDIYKTTVVNNETHKFFEIVEFCSYATIRKDGLEIFKKVDY